jgi:hypothetical protein
MEIFIFFPNFVGKILSKNKNGKNLKINKNEKFIFSKEAYYK